MHTQGLNLLVLAKVHPIYDLHFLQFHGTVFRIVSLSTVPGSPSSTLLRNPCMDKLFLVLFSEFVRFLLIDNYGGLSGKPDVHI
jgi:hypothetical protein